VSGLRFAGSPQEVGFGLLALDDPKAFQAWVGLSIALSRVGRARGIASNLPIRFAHFPPAGSGDFALLRNAFGVSGRSLLGGPPEVSRFGCLRFRVDFWRFRKFASRTGQPPIPALSPFRTNHRKGERRRKIGGSSVARVLEWDLDFWRWMIRKPFRLGLVGRVSLPG
jgi:hypothetical protein